MIVDDDLQDLLVGKGLANALNLFHQRGMLSSYDFKKKSAEVVIGRSND